MSSISTFGSDFLNIKFFVEDKLCWKVIRNTILVLLQNGFANFIKEQFLFVIELDIFMELYISSNLSNLYGCVIMMSQNRQEEKDQARERRN